MRLAGF
jgi:hypothetical protein